jgi:hypothetical protein
VEESNVKNKIAIMATTNLEYHLVGYRNSDDMSMLVWPFSARRRVLQRAVVVVNAQLSFSCAVAVLTAQFYTCFACELLASQKMLAQMQTFKSPVTDCDV